VTVTVARIHGNAFDLGKGVHFAAAICRPNRPTFFDREAVWNTRPLTPLA
jgi:hypothetical protein